VFFEIGIFTLYPFLFTLYPPQIKMGLQLKMGCDTIRGVLGKQGMNNRFEFTRFYYYFGFSRRSGFVYA
jgi:hypothetical protein